MVPILHMHLWVLTIHLETVQKTPVSTKVLYVWLFCASLLLNLVITYIDYLHDELTPGWFCGSFNGAHIATVTKSCKLAADCSLFWLFSHFPDFSGELGLHILSKVWYFVPGYFCLEWELELMYLMIHLFSWLSTISPGVCYNYFNSKPSILFVSYFFKAQLSLL